MHNSLKISLACLSTLAVLGCTEVLDSQANGAAPSGPGPLAGPPAGDSASSSGNVIYNSGNTQLLADGSSSGVLNLVTGGKPHNTDSYSISFSGVKLTITEEPVLAIDALDTSGQLACGLEIAGGEFRLVSGAGTSMIGTYSGNADQHNVVMRLDLDGNRCFVVITQVAQGTSGPQIQAPIEANGPIFASSFGDLDRLRVAWEDTAGAGATSYFLGRTVISKQN
ncbi:hypothetical protein [uncultured Roseobacter sp.]|uniref:hypothetical protein n=1 Tax=uncultured Roseobacter sp. TaxID=114847 RepID=UPI0026288994|nr:hypothetical protein [uncultured Roseobacter sp.]